MTRRTIISVILKVIIIMAAVIGIADSSQSSTFMGDNSVFFFTIQSNITISAVCAVFLFFDFILIVFKRIVVVPNWLYLVKYVFTVAISLTFLVFSLLLMPFMLIDNMAWYMITPANLCCHNIVPICAIVDWMLFDRKSVRLTISNTFLGLFMPIYYLCFSYICSAAGVNYGESGNFAYFFLDYTRMSWFNIDIANEQIGVFYWLLLLLGIVVGLGFIFKAFNSAYIRKSKTK